MKPKATLLLGLLVCLSLLLYMISFQVRFHESAVVTTFGRAGDDSVRNADGQGAGFYWKWPWPVQEVRVYDKRIQILESQLEQQQTRDSQVVIPSLFLAWRIAQPLDFFRSLKNPSEAENQLRMRLRSAQAVIGGFAFEDLVNTDASKLKLAEAEQTILAKLQAELEAQHYGVTVETVGIKRLLLPADVTQKVAERMRSTRKRLAQDARSSGDAAAGNIRAKANSAAQRILAFAERRAQSIRAEGDEAAAKYNQAFQRNESFQIFLLQVEALKEVLRQNTTILLDPRTVPFDLFVEPKASGAPNATGPKPSGTPEKKKAE